MLGYAIGALVVGIVRELLAYGTLFGMNVFEPLMPAAKSPFFGFFLIGILAAVCRAVSGKRTRASTDRGKEETS